MDDAPAPGGQGSRACGVPVCMQCDSTWSWVETQEVCSRSSVKGLVGVCEEFNLSLALQLAW